ncbi:hypothetical protein OIU78_022657 [Salix suchowensis]|nr:hypothetical protein OIU78_022657 [Salix suchowensis]
MSILRMNNSVLYTEARLTPLSLTYYVPCLANGNYSVKLHFAEIVIRGSRSYYSLGRRVFDVYIQDFNIVMKAGGVDKVYIHNCTALVTNGALEIRFHWAGKGTTWSLERGAYGPLISAIDVESDFAPPNNGRRKRFIIAGAVVLPLFLIFILLSSLWWKGYLGGRKSRDRELVGLDLVTGGITEIVLTSSGLDTRLDKFLRLENVAFSFKHYDVVTELKYRWKGLASNYVVLYLQKNGDIMEMVDPRLGSAFNKKEVVRMINVALLCTNQSPALRPAMSTVVSMLEGKTDVEELDPSRLSDQEGYELASFNESSSETKSLVKSFEGPCTAPSSPSTQDLYSIN